MDETPVAHRRLSWRLVNSWPRVTATQMIRQMSGASRSVFCKCDDGNHYIVKLLGNPQGPNVLANELLGAELVRLMGVESPPTSFIFIPGQLLRSAPIRWFAEYDGKRAPEAGYFFGSQFVGNPADMKTTDWLCRRKTLSIGNQRDFLKMLILDVWANNQDSRQAVLTPGHRQKGWTASFIDHGSMFGGPRCIFDDTKCEGSYFYKSIYRGTWSEHCISKCNDIITEFAHQVIDRHFENVPADWHDSQHEKALTTLLDRRHCLYQLMNVYRDRLVP